MSKEAEIGYVYLVGVLDVLFGGLDFSAPYHPLTAPKKLFFGPSKLSEEAEIRYVYLAVLLDVPFGGLDFSVSFHPFTAPKKIFFAVLSYFLSSSLA